VKTEALGAKAADPPVMAASPALVCQELLSVGVGVVVKVAAVAKVEDHLRLSGLVALAAWTEVSIDAARTKQEAAPQMRQCRHKPGLTLGCGAGAVLTRCGAAADAHPRGDRPGEGAQRCAPPWALPTAGAWAIKKKNIYLFFLL